MIQSSAKIKIDKTDLGSVVSIYPELLIWQRFVLGFWIIAWLLSGLLGIAGMIASKSSDSIGYIVVFMGFWFYFLFFAIRSFLWNHYGKEYIRITAETLDYKRGWGKIGRAHSYDLKTIKNLGMINENKTSFAKTYQDAFWTIGGEVIGFEYIGQKIAIGLRLTDDDAKLILKSIAKVRKED